MKVIDGFNDRGNPCKEDRLGFGDDYMFILDGATGVANNRIPNYSSDAVWFVETASKFLNEQLANASNKKTEIILKELTNHINAQFKALKIGDVSKLEMPSAAFIMARKIGQQLELISIGDCTGVIEFHSEKYELIYDDRISKLDNKVVNTMQQIKKERDISMIEAKPYVKELLIKNRLLRNEKDGYQALDFTDIVLEKVVYRKVPYPMVKSVYLFSDGVDSYFNDFKLSDGPIGLIKDIKDKGVHQLLDRLRIKEESDPNCDRYPRLKMKDDATLIWAVCEEA